MMTVTMTTTTMMMMKSEYYCRCVYKLNETLNYVRICHKCMQVCLHFQVTLL